MSTVECVVCGHVGAAKKKGSTFITIMLLIFLFPIGILYWLLNRSGGKVCSACGSSNVKLYIPVSRVVQQPVIQNIQAEPAKTFSRTKLVAHDAFSHNAGVRIDQEIQSENIEFKACPYCAEDIKAAAIKCKHCGSMVEV